MKAAKAVRAAPEAKVISLFWREPAVPLLVKVPLTAFTAVLIPVYWREYGPQNFLWLSDISLFMSVYMVWRPSPLMNSMLVVGVLPLEIVWNLDFFGRLLFGWEGTGLAAYMFDDNYPLYLRALSLFHVPLPPLWIWLAWRWGYDKRALPAMTRLFLAVIPLTYLLSGPADNINWVYHPEVHGWRISQGFWLMGVMAAIPLLVFWPMHGLMKRIARPAPG
jgi:hypothetical protein